MALALVAVLVVFSLSENGDVVREDEDFVLHLSQSKEGGLLQVSEGWCLQAAASFEGSQVTVAKCSHAQSLQRWHYEKESGLVQLETHHGELCAHADYISEAEGSLLSLQSCAKGAKRQMYDLDVVSNTMNLRHAPELCLHSVSTKLKSGRPVLLLKCPTVQKTPQMPKAKKKQKKQIVQKERPSEDAEDTATRARHFLGHPLTQQDKQDEGTIMHDILRTVHKAQTPPVHPKKVVNVPVAVPKAAKAVEVEASSKEQASQASADNSQANEPSAEEQTGAEEQAARHVIHTAQKNTLAVREKLKAAQAAVRKVDSSLPGAQQLMAKAKNAQHDAEQELEQIRAGEKTQLQAIMKQVKGHYEQVSAKATRQLKEVQDHAHRLSERLQRRAKAKTAAVIAKSKKSLEEKLNELSRTLTDSVDRRQRARAQLVALRSQHADEVELAQHALDLAKVNKATHEANAHAREAAKRARTRTMRSVGFAKTILGSRLKAVRTTERLSVDKQQLRAHAMMTEAKEVLSRTTQTVLMELDDADSSVPLKDILGEEAIIDAKQAATSKVGGDIEMQTSEFDEEVEPSDVGSMGDDELIGSHAAMLSHAAADTVYTSKMHRCKFPFTYNGEKLYHCKQSVHGSWCATDVDEKTAVRSWDYCVQNQRAVFLAKQAAMEAAKLEIKRVLAATGAEISPDALRESLQAAAAAQAAPVPAVSNKGKPDEQDLKSQSPVMGRVQAEHAVDSFINHHASV
jgi:hypothetical protein